MKTGTDSNLNVEDLKSDYFTSFTLEPRRNAVLCPVCIGTGNLDKVMPPYTGTHATCHGCGGRGWVVV